MFDAGDVLTEDASLSVKNVYTIECRRLINRQSSANIMIAKKTTSSTISVELPNVVQLSSTPLTGSFKIKCIDSEGYESYGIEIGVQHAANWDANNVFNGCDMFYDRFEMWDTYEKTGDEEVVNYYRQNGFGLWIKFQGLNEDPGQFELISSESDPMVGDNLQITWETVTNYNSNLFYEPIPFEMLKTYETQPQLIVSVDGLPAVCHNLTCGYAYVDPVGTVTAFTFNAGASSISITGTDFDASPIKEIKFAKSRCLVDAATFSATNIDCTLEREPTCGTFIPVVIADMGIIPGDVSLVGTEVVCTATSATPFSNLNLLGGDNITISGTNFPHELSDSTVVLNFDDAQTTTCVPQTSTTDTLVCLTGAFDFAASAGASHGLSITINEHSVSNSLSAALRPLKDSSLYLTPASASPVLKTHIVILLEETFTPTLAIGDFTVNATSWTDPTYKKMMNVIAVNDADRTLTVLFGGAYSGDYYLSIRHSSEGLIDTAGLTLNVGATVTNVSPMTMSIYGGGVLTITGTNFGNEFTDNPVQLFANGKPAVNCYLLTTGPTEITCQVDDSITMANADMATVIVYLKASEEATCDASVCQGFEFSDSSIPTIETVVPAFDDVNNNWDLVITGTNFADTTDGIVFEANGVA
jgi:hypothetical protein